MSDTKERSWEERSQELGACTYSSLKEMVDALQCDYDRLAELREEKAGWEYEEDDVDDLGDPAYTPNPKSWEEECPDEADELKELEEAAGDCEDEEQARERIMEDPLSLQVRSGWASCKEEFEAEEFEILLGTGGPAMRLIGELDQYRQPTNVRLQVQDWFTPWTDYRATDHEVLEAYCLCFYFGE